METWQYTGPTPVLQYEREASQYYWSTGVQNSLGRRAATPAPSGPNGLSENCPEFAYTLTLLASFASTDGSGNLSLTRFPDPPFTLWEYPYTPASEPFIYNGGALKPNTLYCYYDETIYGEAVTLSDLLPRPSESGNLRPVASQQIPRPVLCTGIGTNSWVYPFPWPLQTFAEDRDPPSQYGFLAAPCEFFGANNHGYLIFAAGIWSYNGRRIFPFISEGTGTGFILGKKRLGLEIAFPPEQYGEGAEEELFVTHIKSRSNF